MKKRIVALAVPLCGLIHSAGVVRGQEGGEGGEPVQKTATIVIQDKGGDAESLHAKVAEALEKAGVAGEMREKVLKQLSESKELSKKAKAKTEEALKKIQLKVGEKIQGAQEGDDVLVIAGEGADDTAPLMNQVFKARVVRNMVDQKYRIGVSCGAAEAEEGEEKTEGDVKGLRVNSVLPDSPAATAGIKEGDNILRVNDKELTSVEQLLEVVQVAGKAAKELSIDIARGEEKLTLKVKPAEIKDVDKVVENIDWSMPRGGWVFNGTGEGFKSIQIPQMPVNGAFAFSADSSDLKKEIEGLRKEIRELKELVKELKK